MMTVGIIMSNDLRKRSAHCPILRETDNRKEGRYVVIAAGQKPADLKIAGTEHLTTSEQFLELDELPKRILFIGGAYIAFEFAHVAVRAGARVTIAGRGPRLLPRSTRIWSINL
jgi:pyruvate/2-oxoglutarate dehydrogenase complex dihydrolipoamide dehydrogenase (E3) component